MTAWDIYLLLNIYYIYVFTYEYLVANHAFCMLILRWLNLVFANFSGFSQSGLTTNYPKHQTVSSTAVITIKKKAMVQKISK